MFAVIAETEKRMVAYYKGGGEVSQFYKPYAAEDGIAVKHLHFHVLPRLKDDVLDRIRIKERVFYQTITEQEVAAALSMFGNGNRTAHPLMPSNSEIADVTFSGQ